MNELEQVAPQPIANVERDAATLAPVAGDGVPERIKNHVQAANWAWQLAQLYVDSDAIPDHFKRNVSRVAISILQGAQFGFDPLTSLNNIHIIKNRAALSSRALHAILKQHGYRLEVLHRDEQECTVRITDPNTNEQATETWTWQRAQRMGLTTTAAGKGPNMWMKDPQNMLYQRAVAYAARQIAPHLLMGLPYTVEEIQDMDAVAAPPAETQVQTAPVQQVQSITVERVQGAPDLVQVCAQIQQAKTVEQLQRIMSQTEGMSDEDKVTLKEQADRKYNQLAPQPPVQAVTEGEYVEVDHY